MKWTRNLRWMRFPLPILMIGVLAVACGDDDATGVTIADLAGDWTANSVVVSNNDLLPVDPMDLVALGVDVTLDIDADGSFTFATDGLGAASGGLLDDVTITGTIEITGEHSAEVTASTDPDDPSPATFTLSGDDLTISIPDAALIDFDDSGEIEEFEFVDLAASLTR
jgi:hypothetical protein